MERYEPRACTRIALLHNDNVRRSAAAFAVMPEPRDSFGSPGRPKAPTPKASSSKMCTDPACRAVRLFESFRCGGCGCSGETEKALRVAVADVTNNLPDQFHIIGDESALHVASENVAEQAAEVFVARVGDERAAVGEHAD